MQETNAEVDRARLVQLDRELRAAIATSLIHDLPYLAVALDIARDLLERVLAEEEPTRTRIAVARAHAELALQVWREAVDATLLQAAPAQG